MEVGNRLTYLAYKLDRTTKYKRRNSTSYTTAHQPSHSLETRPSAMKSERGWFLEMAMQVHACDSVPLAHGHVQ